MGNIVVKAKKQKLCFLGGTCADSTWRENLIPKLEINYFNPVVEEWTPECQEEEIRQRNIADYVLYVITPAMKGVYSIAEAVDDSNKRPDKTIFCVLYKEGKKEFGEDEKKSLKQVEEMIKRNGGTICNNLDEVAKYLNRDKK
jgi:hypothetical protein